MTDEGPTAQPVPPPPSTSAISLGMACMVMSIPVLLYSAFDIFEWLPRALDVYKSVKVKIDLSTEIMCEYGTILWMMVAVAMVLSLLEAWRHPGRPRTVAIQVSMFVAAVILAYLARHAMWYPLTNLLEGIGTQRP